VKNKYRNARYIECPPVFRNSYILNLFYISAGHPVQQSLRTDSGAAGER